MTVRRLADDAVQPPSFAFSGENLAWAQQKIAQYPAGRQQSAVIPLLWRAQEQEGWITRAAIESIAAMLNMAYIRVLEVATFYTQFLLKPVGTNAHIQVCGTTPCMLRGAEELRAVCQHKINHEPFKTNAEGTMSWEEVECLGACVNAPMVMIGNDTYEDLTVERFEQIVDAFAAGRGATVQPGPQIARLHSAAEGGATTLNEEPTAERTYKPFPPPPPPAPAPGAPAAPTAPAAPAAPVAPAAPAAPAAPPPPPAAAAAEQKPNMPGRSQGEVPVESAPAIKGPPNAPKVSEGKAERERTKFREAAHADGEPNQAMREGATGAESPAGKIDSGAATNKAEPKKLFDAPSGKSDNLRMITGIGPALERTLNAIGITTFAQLAALTPEQIAAVESELGFRGRVARDNWLQQAEVLERGGAAEYRKVFGRDPK